MPQYGTHTSYGVIYNVAFISFNKSNKKIKRIPAYMYKTGKCITIYIVQLAILNTYRNQRFINQYHLNVYSPSTNVAEFRLT
jgi:hypothetical protein